MDNVYASRLGAALGTAEKASFGDNIDRGLALFAELDRRGFILTVRDEARCDAGYRNPYVVRNGATRFKQGKIPVGITEPKP